MLQVTPCVSFVVALSDRVCEVVTAARARGTLTETVEGDDDEEDDDEDVDEEDIDDDDVDEEDIDDDDVDEEDDEVIVDDEDEVDAPAELLEPPPPHAGMMAAHASMPGTTKYPRTRQRR